MCVCVWGGGGVVTVEGTGDRVNTRSYTHAHTGARKEYNKVSGRASAIICVYLCFVA